MDDKKEKRKRELEEEIKKLQNKLYELSENEKDQIAEESEIKFSKPLPPLPPEPQMPHSSPKIFRRHDREPIIIDHKKQHEAEEQRHRIMEEKEEMERNLEELREQLREREIELIQRQHDFSEMKRDLIEKAREIREKERKMIDEHRSSYTWDFDMNEDIEDMTSDLETKLGDYTKSILSSVAEGLKRSMGITIKDVGNIKEEFKNVEKELGKIGKEIGTKISKEINIATGPTIPEEKIEEFYVIGANIVSSIGDPNRLRILKELEKGPKYQKELSYITNLRGGTFKHHMDKLLEDDVKFVTQEVVRGRYLLTTRGREALKLA